MVAGVADTDIPDHESPLRRMMADAHGHGYRAHASLEVARSDSDAAVVMESDDGGQILLTCPVSVVRCGLAALEALLVWLDAVAWSGGGDPTARRLLFEHRPIGSGLAGGMGGGVIGEGVWLHPQLAQIVLDDDGSTVADVARRVIAGEELQMPSTPLPGRS